MCDEQTRLFGNDAKYVTKDELGTNLGQVAEDMTKLEARVERLYCLLHRVTKAMEMLVDYIIDKENTNATKSKADN